MKFEETELRLGLPGAGAKRGFAETIDLNLNLNFSKEALMDEIEKIKEKKSFTVPRPPLLIFPNPQPNKAQVVGWPPVRAYRKNMVTAVQTQKKDESSESSTVSTGAAYVKVSMDDTPYLRKMNLKMYKSCEELSDASVKMFHSFISAGSSASQGINDFMNEKKLVDLLNGSEYVLTFEDNDGDWMLGNR